MKGADVTPKRSPHIRNSKALISMTIDPDQCAMLDALVTLRRSSRAALMREIVDFYFRENRTLHPIQSNPSQREAA